MLMNSEFKINNKKLGHDKMKNAENINYLLLNNMVDVSIINQLLQLSTNG